MSDLDMIPTDSDMFVGIASDDDGRTLIGLDATALAALSALLDTLPLYHDMIDDGYSPAAVDVAGALRAAVARHV